MLLSDEKGNTGRNEFAGPKIREIFLELTNVCNMNCRFCPNELMTRKKGYMDLELAKKIIDEIAEKDMAGRISFWLMGEPLLHKDFFTIIDYAQNKGLTFDVVTNGSLFNSQNINSLLRRNFREICISLHNFNEEDFLWQRRPLSKKLDFSTYIGGIMNFLEAHYRESSSIPVSLSVLMPTKQYFEMVGMESYRSTEEIKLNALAFAAEIKEKILKIPGRADFKVEHGDCEVHYIHDKLCIALKPYGNWMNQRIPEGYEVQPVENEYCDSILTTFGIFWDGQCTFCCNDFDGKINLGNVYTNSLSSIYRKTLKIREATRQGRLLLPACQVCRGILINSKTGKPVDRELSIRSHYILNRIKNIKKYRHLGIKNIIKIGLKRLYKT
jgi:molybdenum cofactor biosynthesis enzyme MoaA